jgi:hypothetical protein
VGGECPSRFTCRASCSVRRDGPPQLAPAGPREVRREHVGQDNRRQDGRPGAVPVDGAAGLHHPRFPKDAVQVRWLRPQPHVRADGGALRHGAGRRRDTVRAAGLLFESARAVSGRRFAWASTTRRPRSTARARSARPPRRTSNPPK